MFPVSSIPLLSAFLYYPHWKSSVPCLCPTVQGRKGFLPSSASPRGLLWLLKATPGSLGASSVGCSGEHVPSHCQPSPSAPSEPNSFPVFMAELYLSFQHGMILQRKAYLAQYIYLLILLSFTVLCLPYNGYKAD